MKSKNKWMYKWDDRIKAEWKCTGWYWLHYLRQWSEGNGVENQKMESKWLRGCACEGPEWRLDKHDMLFHTFHTMSIRDRCVSFLKLFGTHLNLNQTCLLRCVWMGLSVYRHVLIEISYFQQYIFNKSLRACRSRFSEGNYGIAFSEDDTLRWFVQNKKYFRTLLLKWGLGKTERKWSPARAPWVCLVALAVIRLLDWPLETSVIGGERKENSSK